MSESSIDYSLWTSELIAVSDDFAWALYRVKRDMGCKNLIVRMTIPQRVVDSTLVVETLAEYALRKAIWRHRQTGATGFLQCQNPA